MANPTLVFQAFLTLHLIGLALGLGGAFIADFSFFKAVRQADRISPETVTWMRSFSQVVWIGLGVLALSGIGLFLLDPAKYLHSAGFLAKMALVLVLIVNGLFLNFYSTARLTTFNFSEKYHLRSAAWRARKLSFIFGAISAVTWYSVLLLAMLKSFVHLPFAAYIGVYLVVLAGAIAGSLVLERLLFMRAKPRTLPVDLNNIPITELASYSAQDFKNQTAVKPAP